LKNISEQDSWLPISVKEMELLGWEQPDVILFSGDAYVDHPSFGVAVIGRLLQSFGLKVAIVPQPNWRDDLRDFKKMGRPRLFFGVTAGNMDSMVNHYTANRRLRSDDAFTPGGKSGFRPDYATSVYSKVLKECFPDVPVIIGGIEASLRRVTHFDYWKDQLLPSILQWSNADMLIYGMGEQPLKEIVRLLERGVPFKSLTTIAQTAIILDADKPLPAHKKWNSHELHNHEDCLNDKRKYAENFRHVEEESNKMEAVRLHQKCGNKRIIINPQYPVISTKQLDEVYDLPFTRLPHPKYLKKGVIPAYEMIKHSVTLHRGCFGGCSFCTISAHQGKFISSRSKESIIKEVTQITQMNDFKGYISDLGGPSANMYMMQGNDLTICEKCKRPSCIFPAVCNNLNTSHNALIDIYKSVDNIDAIKKSFVGSGVRYDLFLNQKATEKEKASHKNYARELIEKHVSGRLKVAPEHTSEEVLKLMRKPSFTLFEEFNKLFNSINKSAALNQQLIPYFISSHPASGERDMAKLAAETKKLNFTLEQVQDFTPTPMTLATVIYYSGLNPYTLKPVYTAKTSDEKLQQRMFFFWYKPEMRTNIIKSLHKNGLHSIEKELFDKGSSKKNTVNEKSNFTKHNQTQKNAYHANKKRKL
jgi:uncharacterized radical SAM protein YgiQ